MKTHATTNQTETPATNPAHTPTPRIYHTIGGARGEPTNLHKLRFEESGKELAAITLSGHLNTDLSQGEWAEVIARAVNSHASLVEALTEALMVLEANKLDALGCENIRAALALAKGAHS